MMRSIVSARWMLHRVHKWMGLFAAIWLLVLGLTGFLLDHRDTWRWLWQDGLSENYITDVVVDKSKSGQIKYYQINPLKPQQHAAAGLTGLWWSENSGISWSETTFNQTEHPPMISAILFSNDNKLWIASDDGLWLSQDAGKTAQRIALPARWVSAITYDASLNRVTGIIERASIFHYSIFEKNLTWLEIEPVRQSNLPDEISFSRFTRDIHYGRGMFYNPISLLWNDIAAIAMIVLPLTGFLFYWMPRRWKQNRKKKVNHKYKKQSIRWLFRLHGPVFGLVSAVPILYLSLTGILLDHSEGLRSWMKSIQVSRSWQTPVYNLSSWEGELYGVAGYPNNANKLSIATRLGLFTTDNNGKNWQREILVNDKSFFIWTLRRHKNNLYIGGMGGPNLVKVDQQEWHLVKGVGHMPSDITFDEKSGGIWKSRHGLKSSTFDADFLPKDINFPHTNFIPWFYIIDGLHSGLIIHSQWKWFNDLIAVLAIILVVTGLLRWWHNKWI